MNCSAGAGRAGCPASSSSPGALRCPDTQQLLERTDTTPAERPLCSSLAKPRVHRCAGHTSSLQLHSTQQSPAQPSTAPQSPAEPSTAQHSPTEPSTAASPCPPFGRAGCGPPDPCPALGMALSFGNLSKWCPVVLGERDKSCLRPCGMAEESNSSSHRAHLGARKKRQCQNCPKLCIVAIKNGRDAP